MRVREQESLVEEPVEELNIKVAGVSLSTMKSYFVGFLSDSFSLRSLNR